VGVRPRQRGLQFLLGLLAFRDVQIDAGKLTGLPSESYCALPLLTSQRLSPFSRRIRNSTSNGLPRMMLLSHCAST
jgi:hypothetical protein